MLGISYPPPLPAIANHHKVGNRQYPDRTANLTGTAQDMIIRLPTADTWQSVGPTGSGADYVWSTLDILPARARALICIVNAEATGLTASGGYVNAKYAPGNAVLDVSAHTWEGLQIHHDCESNQALMQSYHIEIPLNANHVFQMRWLQVTLASAELTHHYNGFIAD